MTAVSLPLRRENIAKSQCPGVCIHLEPPPLPPTALFPSMAALCVSSVLQAFMLEIRKLLVNLGHMSLFFAHGPNLLGLSPLCASLCVCVNAIPLGGNVM